MAKDGKDDTVSISRSEIAALVGEAIRQAMEAVKPLPLHEQAKENAKLNPFEQKRIRFRSVMTGSTFDAVIERGQIMTLENYEEDPVRTEVAASEGGEVPDGYIRVPDVNGVKQDFRNKIPYKHWRWQNYWFRDLSTFPGKLIEDERVAALLKPVL
jgi:hypothetical protein